MKLEISTPLLQVVCNKAVKAVSTKDIIPSLKNFLFDVTEKNIHIIAGDGATYVEKDIACNQIQEIGQVSVDAKDFTKLINKINSDTVILSTKDNKLGIKAGKSNFHLKTIDAAEYIYPENLQLTVTGKRTLLPELKKALKLGSITTSKNATEVYFTGYKIGKQIVTTNRNNITFYSINLCEDDLLLTQDLVDLIYDLDGESVEFGYTEDFVEFRTEGTRVLGNLLCGLENFPSDDLMEAYTYTKKAVVSKKALLPVLDRALIFVEHLGSVRLTFKDGVIQSQLVNNLDVDTYEEIPFEGNADISIQVNVGMLHEICSALDSDVVELHVAEEMDPLLVKAGACVCLMASMVND